MLRLAFSCPNFSEEDFFSIQHCSVSMFDMCHEDFLIKYMVYLICKPSNQWTGCCGWLSQACCSFLGLVMPRAWHANQLGQVKLGRSHGGVIIFFALSDVFTALNEKVFATCAVCLVLCFMRP